MAAYVEIDSIQYPVVFDPPGEQTNILQLPEISDPGLLKLYAVLEGDANPDRFITYVNLVKLLLASNNVRVGQHTVVAGSNSLIFKVGGVNTPLTSVNYAIIILGGETLGVNTIVKSINGITFEAIDPGTIDYIAILNT